MNWYKKAQNNYNRRDIMMGNVSIGHITYKMDKNKLIIDMIMITDRNMRRQGIASNELIKLIQELKPTIVTPSEDGFTSEGEELFRSVAEKIGAHFNENGYIEL